MTCGSVCRYLKSAMHLQPRSWAITPGMTTSLAWSRRTPTKHRPWLTLWQPLGGTMSQHWLPKATMERVVWRRSPRSPERLVSVCLSGLVFTAAKLQSIAEFWWGVCSVGKHPWVCYLDSSGQFCFWHVCQGGSSGSNLRRKAKNISWPFRKGAAPWWLRGKKQPYAEEQTDLRKCNFWFSLGQLRPSESFYHIPVQINLEVLILMNFKNNKTLPLWSKRHNLAIFPS